MTEECIKSKLRLRLRNSKDTYLLDNRFIHKKDALPRISNFLHNYYLHKAHSLGTFLKDFVGYGKEILKNKEYKV